jgi:hypothetical protein
MAACNLLQSLVDEGLAVGGVPWDSQATFKAGYHLGQGFTRCISREGKTVQVPI